MVDFNWYIEKDIPFVEKGRDESGLDCWGLVQLFYKREYDKNLPDYTAVYENTKDLRIAKTIIDQKEKHWKEVKTPKEGDVILCRMNNHPMHVGIYKDGGFMLHIEKGNNASIENINGLKWKRRILGIYRLSM